MDSIVGLGLPDDIGKEFSVNPQGYGSISRRGIARLSGVTEGAIRKVLKAVQGAYPASEADGETHATQGDKGAYRKIPDVLLPFAGQSFASDEKIPDLFAAAIIKHYAYQGNKQAQKIDGALGAIGLRTLIQKTLNWEAPRKLSEREIVEMMCLPVPTEWQPRFSVEFYGELERLTGLVPLGHKRPALWAKITKELVYDYLPKGVYSEIKAWQRATDPNKKLHQFLSDQGIEILGEQLKRVITVMQCSACMKDVERMLNQSMSKLYQPSLFPKIR